MAASTSSRRSSGPVLGSNSPGRFSSPSSLNHNRRTSASAFASSTASAFTSRPSSFNRSASPTRINLYSSSSSQSVRFSLDSRSSSPTGSVSAAARSPSSHGQVAQRPATVKRTCMCSPTNHPGSFRCSLHKATNSGSNRNQGSSAPYQSNRLNARRSAMTNSLVRIGTVEGELVKRALTALIRPSSHQQRRRTSFQSRPSRLSVMSRAEES